MINKNYKIVLWYDIIYVVLYNNDKELVIVKVKYIDKCYWCCLIDREYIEVKVNNNRFKGIIGLVMMKKVCDLLEVMVVG